MKARALLLFSEGLDSILAGKILALQGIEVYAVRFITPFFGWKWKGKEKEFDTYVREEFGFHRGIIKDITKEYLAMLKKPPHGYGSQFNPCIDCKILMLKHAKKMLPHVSAQFLATGEVVGQRPMSQLRNILRHIEKQAQVEDILLRPLCALKLKETKPEREGLVDRSKLLDIAGRGRKRQLALAKELGLKKIPSPAGGCLLTDPSLAPRIKRFFEKEEEVTPKEAELLTFGRHFELPHGSWLVLGRDAEENERIKTLSEPGDTILKLRDFPGPTGIFLILCKDDLLEGAKLVKKYAPKARKNENVAVRIISNGEENIILV
ncbi:thiamine biosynthesis protein [Thermodesulfatator atlanticus]|uniref:thiamine biosynthesis protein n=1 Tax=Thermodesulfatator atlanticus TaxID=501497 RepID=UPI0003B4F4E6|nr:thiamine biosynthesis protein [Thermodesulfatator atlanticus]